RKPRDRRRDGSNDRTLRDALKEASPESLTKGPAPTRNRDASPEPYRKPRDRSRDKREGSKGRTRDRSREKTRDRSKERHRERSRDRDRDRNKDRRRDRSRDRHGERSRDRYGDRSRDKKRERSRERDSKKLSPSRRSASPLPYRPSHKRRDRSPSPARSKRAKHSSSPPRRRSKRSPSPISRSRKPLPDQEVSFRGTDNSAQPPTKYGGAPPTLQKPNFKPTGLLAASANKVAGTKISLKYHEPPEARKPSPSSPWRLFIFKDTTMLDTVQLHTQSCWLLGRAHQVADIPLEHPSSSQQHAAIQFRYIVKTSEDEYGVRQTKGKVKPYIIDLESSNGTELNGEKVEPGRYVELRDKDILTFAASEREYVVMLPPKE
ncbi:SMAD/FHA domain-containing protein, partial [Pleomassaria siparia CBS 279.74]